MPQPRIASVLQVDAPSLERAIADLAKAGRIEIALDRDRVPTVMLARR
jgi:hypothetical protein